MLEEWSPWVLQGSPRVSVQCKTPKLALLEDLEKEHTPLTLKFHGPYTQWRKCWIKAFGAEASGL